MDGPTIPISLQECILYSLVRGLSGTHNRHNLSNTNLIAAHPVPVGGKVLKATGYSKDAVSSGGMSNYNSRGV